MIRRLLPLSAAIALGACTQPQRGPEATNEFTVHAISDTGLFLITDNRTTCEYIGSYRGGFILRADPKGNITPNCPMTPETRELYRLGATNHMVAAGK